MVKEIKVYSQDRFQLIDITPEVEKTVTESRVKDGFCLVFVPHSTAAVILTENEEGLKKDWLTVLIKLVSGFEFVHDRIDNNADSHLLSGILGQGKTLPVEKGKLVRGIWQQIFLVELDGPRERKVVVSV
ncbi:MAG TPA: secondary thiamine-phosphate synthase enzyme YjbQ [Candidatus Bathyarchaeia archaeon]|nr:secondary thiamine-phosphate synthase enzyme YjbQ [Candidatus Bathyarchaeia archaeon]